MAWADSKYFTWDDLLIDTTKSRYSLWTIGDDLEALVQGTTDYNSSPALMTIRGGGAMFESTSDFIRLAWQEVVAPEWNVHTIGCVFNQDTVIPDTVTSVAARFTYSIFYGRFANIVIGSNVEKIGDWAFDHYAGSVAQFTIRSNKINYIGNRAFSYCRNATGLDFNGSDLNYIGYQAFNDCYDAVDLNFGNINCEIKGRAFENCYNLERFCIDNRIQGIDISNGDQLGDLGVQHFYECRSLTNITIDDDANFPGRYNSFLPYFYVTPFAGIDCDADGNLITNIQTSNNDAITYPWDLDNRAVTFPAVPFLGVFSESQEPVIFKGYRAQSSVYDIPVFTEDGTILYVKTVDINDASGSGLIVQGENNVLRRLVQ